MAPNENIKTHRPNWAVLLDGPVFLFKGEQEIDEDGDDDCQEQGVVQHEREGVNGGVGIARSGGRRNQGLVRARTTASPGA